MTNSETRSDSPAGPGLIARITGPVIAWALARRPVRAALLYTERRGPMLADSVTYRALFSVFAGVLLGFSIAALWLAGNPVAWQAIIDSVQAAVPGLIGEDGVIKTEDLRAPASLSIAGIISLVALVGSALGAIGSLRTAVRVLAGTVQDDILWIWVILRNLALALGIGVAFVASAFLTFAGQLGVTWIAGMLGLPEDSPVAAWTVRLVSLVVVFALDAVIIIGVFRLLSGVRPSPRSLWSGALLGALGLLALQELSGLFVGGATSNPLLTSFASLLALLIWLNFSAQVMLFACAYIVTAEEEKSDRVHAKFAATTFPQRRLQRAEVDVQIATAELRAAQKAASPDTTS
ncbi:YihY/virulence factor BrkB family protein [Microbacterium sp.]|uniref:YihY/virulence factor BrkB family protein n=1 Tax=Microbacterium sp. TaxID=51671 RepID=UPI0026072A4F|nr:YihY/virulence factor BrkB family protein [Microbacterium sp.]MCV0333304.1 YihY/virulence factor BrkB family protein [Microbacterium sp.]MCV0375749.1 YihY/virulence factor BrkB family protein [Microbacterium sp.]MCV0388896.1 YihY/virulence factor BrkB family protein [Microbacterium sp.]MCV0417424.1 YihY/virulence factor BrkB family protein [Microbacterium sp.]MCV0420735.1 YihY/virulence factor BrkB family protein [Microbacterium sp.]